MRTVYCVLKTGGPYTVQYVEKLFWGICSNTDQDINLVCLTDDPAVNFCTVIPLKHGWPGWWSKIELFREDITIGPGIYFDLDTVIFDNVDPLLNLALEHDFIALRGFNHRYAKPKYPNFASGIMVGDFQKYSQVYTEFLKNPTQYMEQPRENWMHGDQGFIADIIGVENVPRLQDFLPENYIAGKRVIKNHGDQIPKETHVVAWSGEPRLHNLPDQGFYNQLKQKWNSHE